MHLHIPVTFELQYCSAHEPPFLILIRSYLQNDFTKPAAYLNLVNAASTLLAVYGLVVTFKTTRDKLQVYRLTPKFISLQGTILFMNLQSFITSFLGRSGLPYCLESMGSPVRASRESLFFIVSKIIRQESQRWKHLLNNVKNRQMYRIVNIQA